MLIKVGNPIQHIELTFRSFMDVKIAKFYT
jgi:hypothetical protein